MPNTVQVDPTTGLPDPLVISGLQPVPEPLILNPAAQRAADDILGATDDIVHDILTRHDTHFLEEDEEPAPLSPAANLTPWQPTTIVASDTTGSPVTFWSGGTMDNWYTWNTTYTTTTTNTNWNSWNSTLSQTSTGGITYATTWEPHAGYLDQSRPNQHTQEEWAAIQAEHDIRRAERDKIEAAAHAEGRALLEMILDANQRQDLHALRHFDVVGASGQLWRIAYGTSGNVEAIDDKGNSIIRVCAHPRLRDFEDEVVGYLPTEDVMAAQALHLVHDDSEFLRTANVHRGTRRSIQLAPALLLDAGFRVEPAT